MTRLWRDVVAAARDPDAVQAGGALLALLLLGLVATWPRDPLTANDAWYGLVGVRATALVAWGLFQGARDVGRGQRGHLPALVALALWGLLSAPLEWAAFVASAPAVPYGWVLLSVTLLTWSAYGAGWVVARMAAALRLRFVLPILLLSVAVGIVWIDVMAGNGWITPWSVPRVPSRGALVLLGLAAALTLSAAARTWAASRAAT